MKLVETWDGVRRRTVEVQKEKIGNLIVKAQISDADDKYAIDRTVYVDAEGVRYVQIHMGSYATLDYYRNKGKLVKIWF